MTHPAEVVEAVARALYSERSTWTKFENAYPELRAIYDTRAIALLDQIAPQLVAGEREQCAILCSNAGWAAGIRGNVDLAGQADALAAAIRARGIK